MSDCAVVWIRDDFRIRNNHALSYACKNHDAVTVNQVIKIMHKNTNNVKKLLLSILENLDKIKKWDWNDKIYSCLNEAIITTKNSISSKTLKKLKPVLKRRFSL